LRVAAWRLAEWRDLSEPWATRALSIAIPELKTVSERLHSLAGPEAPNPSDPKDLLYLDLEPARALTANLSGD